MSEAAWAERRETLLSLLHATDTVTFVALTEGEIVAELLVARTASGVGSVAISVDASWRRRGVGSALFEAALAWARDRGLRALDLRVLAKNEAALSLYRKLGFEEQASDENVQSDVVTMRLLLAEPP